MNAARGIEEIVDEWNDVLAIGAPADVAEAKKRVIGELAHMSMSADPNYLVAGFKPGGTK